MKKISVLRPFSNLVKYEEWRSSWGDQSQVDIFSYVSFFCGPEDVLLFCRVLFPDFVVDRGGVFLSRSFEMDNASSWFETLLGDVRAVERLLNHTHMYDIFSSCSQGVSDEIFLQLADAVAVSWRLVLRDKFPEKNFSVEVSNTEQDYGPTVTFYQI